jgi:hypothetical protein
MPTADALPLSYVALARLSGPSGGYARQAEPAVAVAAPWLSRTNGRSRCFLVDHRAFSAPTASGQNTTATPWHS